MLWHIPIQRTIPISGGTSSQMGKKQLWEQLSRQEWQPPPEPLCSAGSTFTHVHWLFVPAPVLKISYISFILLLGLLLQQSCFQCLFSFLSSFCLYSQTDSYITKVLRAYSQITTFTLQTFSCFSPALEFFWSREYSVCWGELCTFSALGTGVINMIYLPNVPVISLLWIGPDLDNWLVLMCTEEK